MINFTLNETVNSVTITTEVKGVKKIKEVSLSDFIDTLLQSTNHQKLNTFDIKKEWFFIEEKRFGLKMIHRVQLSENSFLYVIAKEKSFMPMKLAKEFHVGIPNLIFIIKVVNNRFSCMFVRACKEFGYNAPMFAYPFSNVSTSNGRVCIGSNNLSEYNFDNNPKAAFSILKMFFSMPNNMDAYSKRNNSKGLAYGEMLDYLNNKEFDDSLLVESQETYESWLNKIIRC